MDPVAEGREGAQWKADGALVLLTVFWGLTFVVVKDALAFADPFTFLTLRFIVGAAVLAVIARGRMFAPGIIPKGLLLAVVLFLCFALQTVGLTDTTPSRAAFLTGLNVLFVPLLSMVLLRRMPRWGTSVGVVLAAVGLYWLTRPTPNDALSGGGLRLGDWLSIGCAVAYAVHILLTERFASKDNALGLVAVQLVGVAVMSALCLPFVERRLEWSQPLVVAVLACGVLASAVAILVQTWGQARTSAVRAALIFALEPVFASAYSVAVGHEVLGPKEWLGGALIVVGVFASELGTVVWDGWRARGRTPAA
ncbi:putative cystine transporter YijE [Corallococcus coralloides]|uniref:Putative cystine transporter YijE n=1 Tax=Corallococcus coralloides TaxID=184914 RepID=A0A410S0Q1_CORCK|nr:DMT family transporter [Corallococcus coralloides]QAT87710.1 putative cystine transporter YijE [Corallococcus coralloides]